MKILLILIYLLTLNNSYSVLDQNSSVEENIFNECLKKPRSKSFPRDLDRILFANGVVSKPSPDDFCNQVIVCIPPDTTPFPREVFQECVRREGWARPSRTQSCPVIRPPLDIKAASLEFLVNALEEKGKEDESLQRFYMSGIYKLTDGNYHVPSGRNDGSVNITPFELIKHEDKLNFVVKFWQNEEVKTKTSDFSNKDYRPLFYVDPEKNGKSVSKLHVIGDIHGDMNAFLFPLISQGFVKINTETPFTLFSPGRGRRLNQEEIKDAIKNKKPGLIKIPNLVINPSVFLQKEKILYLGDLIDRGEFSVEVFYLMMDLINAQKEVFKKEEKDFAIKFLIGNHELMMLEGFNKYFYQYQLKTDEELPATKVFALKTSPEEMAMNLDNLVYWGDLKIANSFNGILFSHSYPSRKLLEALNEDEEKTLLKISKVRDLFPTVKGLPTLGYNITDPILIKAQILNHKDKYPNGYIALQILEENLKLDRSFIKEILEKGSTDGAEEKLNKFFNKRVQNLFSALHDQGIAVNTDEGYAILAYLYPEFAGDHGLVWVRESKQDKGYDPLPQINSVIGHQLFEEAGVYENSRTLCVDTGQSNAYQKNNISKPETYTFQFGEGKKGDVANITKVEIDPETIAKNKDAFKSGL